MINNPTNGEIDQHSGTEQTAFRNPQFNLLPRHQRLFWHRDSMRRLRPELIQHAAAAHGTGCAAIA